MARGKKGAKGGDAKHGRGDESGSGTLQQRTPQTLTPTAVLVSGLLVVVVALVVRLGGESQVAAVARDGAGCWPLAGEDGSTQTDSSWIVRGSRGLNLSALPRGARPFACYDGRASAALAQQPESAALSDTAVVLVEDFLTESEIAHFRDAIKHYAKPTGHPGYLFAFAAGRQYGESDPDEVVALSNDGPLNDLEDRIAALVGVPASGEETHLQLSLDFAQKGAVGAPPNFHHDKNHGLVRYVTVLIYLSTPQEGGETLFPALPFVPGQPAVRTQQMAHFAGEFENIVTAQITKNKMLTPGSPWPEVQVQEGSTLHQQLAELCSDAAAASLAGHPVNTTRPLAVRPMPGRAVIFWHEIKKGSDPLLDVFHAGCPVLRGEKMSLQKFKNFAPGTPGCEASKWCKSYF